jgi:hypothetical protein
MLEFLEGKTSERKLRLFAVTCCRNVWEFLPDEWCREAIAIAERVADRLAEESELQKLRARSSVQVPSTFRKRPPYPPVTAAAFAASTVLNTLLPRALQAATAAVRTAISTLVRQAYGEREEIPVDETAQRALRALVEEVRRRHAALILDLFGNPFPPSLSPPPGLRRPC